MTVAEAIEQIRSALDAISGTPEEEPVVRALWAHLSLRRPECLMPLGEAFEKNPTAPPPKEPPKGKR